jgi:hypothetical protein
MRIGLVTRSVVVPTLSLVANKLLGPSSPVSNIPNSISNTLTEMVSSTVAHPAQLFLRGGQATTVDLARTSIRLDSINSYAIITALLLNATLRLYSMTPKQMDSNHHNLENIARLLFVLSAGLSMICGTYTTVVFSLLGLYSKTALGMGQDQAFLQFFAATDQIRKRGFDSFLLALLSFEVCFVASLFLNYDGKIRWWLLSLSSIVAIISWSHWQSIVAIAGNLLFRR